jgi:hypothetical protein
MVLLEVIEDFQVGLKDTGKMFKLMAINPNHPLLVCYVNCGIQCEGFWVTLDEVDDN